MVITGKDLIALGFQPSEAFKEMLFKANEMHKEGISMEDITVALKEIAPVYIEMNKTSIRYISYLPESENSLEEENKRAVHKAMKELCYVPTVKSAVVMPDACPAGRIPVGGVVECENAIHPAFHSADICCSMAVSVFNNDQDLKEILDIAQETTHFGPVFKRDNPFVMNKELDQKIQENFFTKSFHNLAENHFGTQGDGNHFLYVGRLESSGKPAIVTHHGSRGFGAQLYKKGMAEAKNQTRKIARKIAKNAEWIVADTKEGQQYWEALQIIREWTRESHFSIHNAIASALGGEFEKQFWNEHNFVFKRGNSYFHAKGATPTVDFLGNNIFETEGKFVTSQKIIPLNMAEPILLIETSHNKEALEFAPHGAGRNMSRSYYKRNFQAEYPEDIDVRFYCGMPDESELPGAYKNADSIISAIEKYDLAKITDKILPFGSIMAGDWEHDAPWRKKKQEK